MSVHSTKAKADPSGQSRSFTVTTGGTVRLRLGAIIDNAKVRNEIREMRELVVHKSSKKR